MPRTFPPGSRNLARTSRPSVWTGCTISPPAAWTASAVLGVPVVTRLATACRRLFPTGVVRPASVSLAGLSMNARSLRRGSRGWSATVRAPDDSDRHDNGHTSPQRTIGSGCARQATSLGRNPRSPAGRRLGAVWHLASFPTAPMWRATNLVTGVLLLQLTEHFRNQKQDHHI